MSSIERTNEILQELHKAVVHYDEDRQEYIEVRKTLTKCRKEV